MLFWGNREEAREWNKLSEKMMEELESLYQDLIIDHYKNPRCRGIIESPDASSRLLNPLCGDEIEVFLALNAGRCCDVKNEGKGCSISQASASMMSELCSGLSIEQLREKAALFVRMMKESLEDEQCDELGDCAALQGVRRFSARIRCAMLPWEALSKCLDQLEPGENTGENTGDNTGENKVLGYS